MAYESLELCQKYHDARGHVKEKPGSKLNHTIAPFITPFFQPCVNKIVVGLDWLIMMMDRRVHISRDTRTKKSGLPAASMTSFKQKKNNIWVCCKYIIYNIKIYFSINNVYLNLCTMTEPLFCCAVSLWLILKIKTMVYWSMCKQANNG